MHQTVLWSIDSVQLFRVAGRRPPEVNLALSRGSRHLKHFEAAWDNKLVEFFFWDSQAKYMVCWVSWWICTALAKAWGSRPLLCPDTWLPSALRNLPVMILIHQMIPCPEGYEPGIIGRGWNRDWACAPHIGVTKLVSQQLELICGEAVVIPQDLVMWRTAGSLNSRMTTEVKVKLGWMCDGAIHSSACWYIATFPYPFCFICTEESCVMSFLHHNIGYSWPVIFFQANTCLSNCY